MTAGSPQNQLGAQRTNARYSFLAGFFGWTFDAFDFFVLTYVVAQVARDFHKPIDSIAFTLTASLLMRPVGAFLFGALADRYGRRIPLMADIVFYSIVEVLSGMAPTYGTFLVLRLLYGVGMGGAWGVGASLAMEAVPAKRRGIFSGILQQGYAVGNLLAALAFRYGYPRWGWRPMFFLGVLPALITLLILSQVQESEAWKVSASKQKDWGSYFSAVLGNWKRFLYLIVLMAMMNFMSHGTQDLYPTFLQQEKHFSTAMTANISFASMVGAIVGGTIVGLISDRLGRRRSMITSALLGIVMIPLWVFAPTTALIFLGAFLMQFMVQGAWGVIPAHINELSPGALRGFFPGLAYQIGVLIASIIPYVEVRMTHHFTYAQTMGSVAGFVFLLAAVTIALGPEAHRVAFGAQTP